MKAIVSGMRGFRGCRSVELRRRLQAVDSGNRCDRSCPLQGCRACFTDTVTDARRQLVFMAVTIPEDNIWVGEHGDRFGNRLACLRVGDSDRQTVTGLLPGVGSWTFDWAPSVAGRSPSKAGFSLCEVNPDEARRGS